MIELKVSKNGKDILLRVPFQEAHYVKDMPHSSFNHRTKVWRGTLNRNNARYLMELKEKNVVELKFYNGILQKLKDLNVDAVIVKKDFPKDYKFKFKPYAYQLEALNHIYNIPTVGLFLDMGLGKTKVSLDTMMQRYLEGKIDTLIVLAPCSVALNWVAEIAEHLNYPYDLLKIDIHKIGYNNKKYKKYIEDFTFKNPQDKFKIVLGNIESFSRQHSNACTFIHDYVKRHDSVGFILDEGHYIKNSSAQRTKTIVGLGNLDNVKNKIVLTGTPISQGIMDIFPIFEFLDKEIIGLPNAFVFKHKYCLLGGYRNKVVIGSRNLDDLMAKINPYIYQKTKDEVFDFPDKIYTTHTVNMTAEQKSAYKELKKVNKEAIENEPENKVMNLLTRMISYQQITSGFITLDVVTGMIANENDSEKEEVVERVVKRLNPIEYNPKINEVKSIISGLNNKEQVIIWCKYTEEINMLSEALKNYKTTEFETSSCVFHGGVDPEVRNREKDLFVKGKSRYFIATQQTGGTGLTLVNARYVIYYSNMFSMLNREQSEDRNHRLGQKNNVTYIDIEAKNTIDSHIKAALTMKKDFKDYILNMMDEGDNILDKI